jgi:hypothetical protein
MSWLAPNADACAHACDGLLWLLLLLHALAAAVAQSKSKPLLLVHRLAHLNLDALMQLDPAERATFCKDEAQLSLSFEQPDFTRDNVAQLVEVALHERLSREGRSERKRGQPEYDRSEPN